MGTGTLTDDAKSQHTSGGVFQKYTYEQIKFALHKWAHFYQNDRFEHWELINAVWEMGGIQDCKYIDLVSGRIKWDMIQYMRTETRFRIIQRAEKEGKFVPKTISLNTPVGLEGGELGELLEAPHAENHTEDYFNWITEDMNHRDTLIVKLRFIEDFTLLDIGKIIGITESRICQQLTNLLPRIKVKLCDANPDLADRKYRKGTSRRNKIDRSRYWRMWYHANRDRILASRRENRLAGVA